MKNPVLKTIRCQRDFTEQRLQLFHFVMTIFKSSLPEVFFKGTVMQIEKALINDRLRFLKFSGNFAFQL